MKTYTLEDSFGQQTTFVGTLLAHEDTDTESRKPRWAELEVWETEGGNFVVRRTYNYRIRHARDTCSRAEGFELVEADETDTHLCTTCGATEASPWAQESRLSIDVYESAQSLIDSFKQDNRFSHFARSVLMTLSDKNSHIHACWNTVRVR